MSHPKFTPLDRMPLAAELITIGVVPRLNDPVTLRAGILGRERRSIARAITLCESALPGDRAKAAQLLDSLPPASPASISIGFSGTPGVGKSTMIEALGRLLVERGESLAVLAIDPSSPERGGSVLGDKTRMPTLASSPLTFVRPSPSGGSLGGLTTTTAEAKRILQAAGFERIFIETVGVGQSEVAVRSVCDLFVHMVAPGGGDELQGIKRGVIELADVLLVSKCDGTSESEGHRTAMEYRSALELTRGSDPSRRATVLGCSALDGESVASVWQHFVSRIDDARTSGQLERRRAQQRVELLERRVTDLLIALATRPHPSRELLENDVATGQRSIFGAAEELVRLIIADESNVAAPGSRSRARG